MYRHSSAQLCPLHYTYMYISVECINLFILPILCIYTVKWSYSVLLMRLLSHCMYGAGLYTDVCETFLHDWAVFLYTSKKFVVPFFIRAILHLM